MSHQALWHVFIDHQIAPLEFREKAQYFFQQEIEHWQRNACFLPRVLLSTCYRIELTVHGAPTVAHELATRFRERFNQGLGFVLEPDRIFKRLALIASGALSPTIGEPHVANQLRKAYLDARNEQLTDPVIDRLYSHVIRCARKIRSVTGIQNGHTSIPTYSVHEIIRRAPSSDVPILLVGTGDMAFEIGQLLLKKGYRNLTVASRSLSRAKSFVQSLGAGHPEVWDFNRVPEYLRTYPVIVTATAAPYYLWKKEDFDTLYDRATRFIIDLAVPRDVEPVVAERFDIEVMTVDDIKHRLEGLLETKKSIIKDAETIAYQSGLQFARWYQTRRLNQYIRTLTERTESIREKVLSRYLKKMPDEETVRYLQEMSYYLTRKVLNEAIQTLKASHDS